mgnify:CR=1 FL=1
MFKLLNLLKQKSREKNVHQTALLLASTILGLLFGFTTNSLLTRILGKVEYGNFAFLFNIFTFCQVIFNFGIFFAIARLVAISNDEKKTRGYYAVALCLIFALYIMMSISLIIFSNVSTAIEKNDLFQILMISIPLGWIYIVINFNESFLQGVSKIKLLSLTRWLPKFIFTLILVVIFFLFKNNTSITTVIFLNYFTLLISCVLVYYNVKPTLANFRKRLYEIFIAVKQFGFDIYLGSLVATGSGSLSGILISYFSINNVDVGYFTLATLLSSPLALIPNIIATVQFKKFANSNKIQTSLTLATLALSFGLLILTMILARFVITAFFGDEYVDAVILLRVLSFGYILYGFGDFFNRFLLAKGKGKELRNASIYIGITLLVANFIMISLYGAMGAAIARIISGLVYVLVILYYYRKEVKRC